MRLWHKGLIHVLPRQQLLAQWRECCCIARNITVDSTPNHILVNKIMDYPLEHLHLYANFISDEMKKRGYKCNYSKFDQWLHFDVNHCTYQELFRDWHNKRYLKQCYYNLQEKYDCGGITDEEWRRIEEAAQK